MVLVYGLVSGGLDSGSTGAGGICVMGGAIAGGAWCSCGGAGNFIVRCLRARRRCGRYGLMCRAEGGGIGVCGIGGVVDVAGGCSDGTAIGACADIDIK